MFDPGGISSFTPPIDMGSRYHDKVHKKHGHHRPQQQGGNDSVEIGQGSQQSGEVKGYQKYNQQKTESAAEVRENYGGASTVKGYDENFLGVSLPLPKPTGRAAEQVLVFGNGQTVRHYTHHSIIMNKERKLCMLTAANIDGPSLREDIDRGKWDTDPVIGAGNQCGESLYKNNIIDKGHMVRRRDVIWGDKNTAAKANSETFYYTNAAPQHAGLNQKKWLDLENWLLQRADQNQQKLSVFTAPVFSDDDINYRGTKIPGQFWKVVVLQRESDHQVAAAAFMMSQEDLLKNLDNKQQPGRGEKDGEIVPTEEVAPYQVTIEQIEKLTGLDFGGLKSIDAFALFQEKQKAEQARGTGAAPYSTYLADSFTMADLPGAFPHVINSAQDIVI